MILDIYKDSFEFASRKKSNLLILGALLFFYFLIIPLFFAYGYNYRIIKQSTQDMINSDEKPADFSDYKQMFIDGLKFMIVVLGYMAIPIFLTILSLMMQAPISTILIILALILSIISYFMVVVAVPHMVANDDSLSAAFRFSELKIIISAIGYGNYLLTYIGIVLISFILIIVVLFILVILLLVSGIATVPFIGNFESIGLIWNIIINFIIFFIVAPYVTLFQCRCIGLVYNLGS